MGPPVAGGPPAADEPPAAPQRRRLVADPDAVYAVGQALAAHAAPGRSEPHPPVILESSAYCCFAADQFVLRHDEPARRLRPSDSVALEPVGLLQEFTFRTGWAGLCYAVSDPDEGVVTALALAERLIEVGRARSVYLCEALRDKNTGVFWAVGTRLWSAASAPGDPVEEDRAGMPVELWERSALVQAHRSRIAAVPAPSRPAH